MRFLIPLVAALLLAVTIPTEGNAQPAPKVTDCAGRTSDLCWEAARTGGGLVKSDVPQVCAEVFQDTPGFVMLVIYDQQGNWINKGRGTHHPELPTHAIMCVGIQDYASKAEQMIWCVDFRPDGRNTHVAFRGKEVIAHYIRNYQTEKMRVDLRWRTNLPQDPVWQAIPEQYVRPRS